MTPPRGRRKADLGVRLQRMLAVVPWLVEVGETTVEEVSARFGMEPDEVVRDLILLSMCGVPPYSMGDLVEVWVEDDGTIGAFDQGLFNQPPRLTANEGFAVLAAGRALLAVPGATATGPLASALDKLEAALGARGQIAVDLDTPPLLPAVQQAAAERESLDVTYYSAWRDEVTERRIDPWLVHAHDGRWYVECGDSRSGERRRLRVDRILSATGTGEHFAPVDVHVPERLFEPGPDAARVELVLPASARWAVEVYEVESFAEEPDGRLRVVVWAAGETWLERLLLKAGPEAEVVAPESLRDVGRRAARRLLARYT